MISFKEFVTEDLVHKNPEQRQDEAGNKQELSVHKGATIKTTHDNPGRFKAYSVYGHERKTGIVHHSSRAHALIVHHQHDLNSTKSNGMSSPSEHARMKKEGRFEVTLLGHDQGAGRSKERHFVKTAAAARKLAIPHAVKQAEHDRETSKFAATMHSYKGFSQHSAR
jgi:hypothetical protein